MQTTRPELLRMWKVNNSLQGDDNEKELVGRMRIQKHSPLI